MKTANFTYKHSDQVTGYGTVTLKDDNKISITNLYFNRSVSLATKDKAKTYAKKIVELDFPSDMCYDFKSSESYSKLYLKLIDATQDFKQTYLEKIKEWSTTVFKRNEILVNTPIVDLYTKYKIPYIVSTTNSINVDHSSKDFNRSNYSEFRNDYNIARDMVTKGIKTFIDINEKKAILHYIASINKLASKLNSKGITNESDCVITNNRLDVNFECVITSGNVVVRAWTIIASGEVQRPHYRYLVK